MARRGLKRDTRFPLIAVESARTAKDNLTVLHILQCTSQNLGLPAGMAFDLVVSNNLNGFGRETWVEVLEEHLDPTPELYTELDGPATVYIGRFEVSYGKA